jgi:hypothetical protein
VKLNFGVWCLIFECWAVGVQVFKNGFKTKGFGIWGLMLGDWNLGFKVQDLGFLNFET